MCARARQLAGRPARSSTIGWCEIPLLAPGVRLRLRDDDKVSFCLNKTLVPACVCFCACVRSARHTSALITPRSHCVASACNAVRSRDHYMNEPPCASTIMTNWRGDIVVHNSAPTISRMWRRRRSSKQTNCGATSKTRARAL